MQLAAQGLPQTASGGMETVGESSSFGVSQFMETARYQHALEAELSRTIKSLRAVQEARVHLAIPKQSAFIRDQQRPTASVLLHLYGGQQLEEGQAASIVNLVAGSIPGMTAADVTLIDQFGRLLSTDDDMRDEETTEAFDPASQVVRSEQISEEQRRASDALAEGVPGALTNTPPEAGGEGATEGEAAAAINSSRRATRNFEVDRTISRTRAPSGTIRRLSVAVLIDEAAITPSAQDAGSRGRRLQRGSWRHGGGRERGVPAAADGRAR